MTDDSLKKQRPADVPNIEVHATFVYDKTTNSWATAINSMSFGKVPQLPMSEAQDVQRRFLLVLDRFMRPPTFPFQGGGPNGGRLPVPEKEQRAA